MSISTSRRSKESQWVPSIERQALSQSVHQVPKFYLRAGNMYLHQGGGKLQPSRQYAWTGTIEQAAAMRRTFSAASGCTAIPQDDPTHSETGE